MTKPGGASRVPSGEQPPDPRPKSGHRTGVKSRAPMLCRPGSNPRTPGRRAVTARA